MSRVKPEQRNRELARVLDVALPHPFRPKKRVEAMSDQEVHAYFTGITRLAAAIALLTAGWLAWCGMRPDSPLPPAPRFTPHGLGTVTKIEVHHTTFSVNSTIETAEGIYQVRGAASGAVGSRVYLKQYEQVDISNCSEICIDSAVAGGCYLLIKPRAKLE